MQVLFDRSSEQARRCQLQYACACRIILQLMVCLACQKDRNTIRIARVVTAGPLSCKMGRQLEVEFRCSAKNIGTRCQHRCRTVHPIHSTPRSAPETPEDWRCENNISHSILTSVSHTGCNSCCHQSLLVEPSNGSDCTKHVEAAVQFTYIGTMRLPITASMHEALFCWSPTGPTGPTGPSYHGLDSRSHLSQPQTSV
jgi:hypothetical protein